GHPGGAPDQETSHFYLLPQLNQLVLDFMAFVCRKSLWQFLVKPLPRGLVCCTRDTYGERSNHWTCRVEGSHCRFKACLLRLLASTQQVVPGNAAIFVDQFGCLRCSQAHFLLN